MFDVVVPKLNNNDQTYTLLDWLVEDGQPVRAGDPLVELETSKALAELEAERDGVVHRLAVAPTECQHGDVIARLFPSEDERQRMLAEARPETRADAGVVITDAARARAEELGIPIASLNTLGRTLVRRDDVDRLAPDRSTVHKLPRGQRAVAAVVTQAHHTIPAASAVMKVEVDAALLIARQLSKSAGVLVGLPELLVKVIGGQRSRFPVFFAEPVADGAVRLADAAHLGVTVDVGTGLFVPVLRDVERQSLIAIAETLTSFRASAMASNFHEADLTGMNLMVSLHNDPDLVLATPLIHPGTLCVVCLAGVQQELTMTDSGHVAQRRVVNLGLTYDHRVINGREAVLFLQALKSGLEYPEELVGDD